jgi:hypothetical protein
MAGKLGKTKTIRTFALRGKFKTLDLPITVEEC